MIMAGDWLKMEKATARKPEIMGIARELSISMDAAFGLCFRFWCWCDDNLTTGNVFCVTESLLDETFGKQNFASAMVKVGWLQFDGDQMTVPNFERHLSKGAKTRAETAIRVAECKKRKREERYSGNESVTKKALPEKRREEKNTESVTRTHEADDLTFLTPPSKPFNRFWDALPDGMKSGQAACVKAFPDAIYAIMASHGIEEADAIEHLVNRTKKFAKSPKGQDAEYRWSPLTFLKDGHYDDSDEAWAAKPARANRSAPAGGQSAEQVRKQNSFDLLAAFAATDEGGFSGGNEPLDRIEANR